MTGARSPQEPVKVSLEELRAGSVSFSTLEAAFGPSSLGIIIVSDLPEQFVPLRQELLQYASYLAHLPAKELEALTCPAAKYLVGWSHGVETLKGGAPDRYKGSYYATCDFYRPTTPRDSATNPTKSPTPPPDNFPEYTHPNLWPSHSILPDFQHTFEALCTLIIDVAVLVARACDRYAEVKIEGYTKGYLESVVRASQISKARLLHYFPPEPLDAMANDDAVNGSSVHDPPRVGDANEDDWCATHLDHGCLTGLTSALYIDESSPLPPVASPLAPLHTLSTSPDPAAGLYIRSRSGAVNKVAIPADALGFQTGEALERITQGKFRAVPHYVKGIARESGGGGRKVARNTLAVFTQPNLDEVVDRETGETFAEFARGVVGRNTVG